MNTSAAAPLHFQPASVCPTPAPRVLLYVYGCLSAYTLRFRRRGIYMGSYRLCAEGADGKGTCMARACWLEDLVSPFGSVCRLGTNLYSIREPVYLRCGEPRV